jgi:hypothetical protein
MPKSRRRRRGSSVGVNEKEGSLDVVQLVLKNANIEAEPLQNMDGFRVVLRDDGNDLTGYAHIVHEARVFMFRLVFPGKVQRNRSEAIEEFVTRANNGMFVGNFELDLDDGEIKFKTYVDYRGTRLRGVYVRNAILSAMEMMEGYAPAIAAVLQGDMSVKAAIESVEGKPA